MFGVGGGTTFSSSLAWNCLKSTRRSISWRGVSAPSTLQYRVQGLGALLRATVESHCPPSPPLIVSGMGRHPVDEPTVTIWCFANRGALGGRRGTYLGGGDCSSGLITPSSHCPSAPGCASHLRGGGAMIPPPCSFCGERLLALVAPAPLPSRMPPSSLLALGGWCDDWGGGESELGRAEPGGGGGEGFPETIWFMRCCGGGASERGCGGSGAGLGRRAAEWRLVGRGIATKQAEGTLGAPMCCLSTRSQQGLGGTRRGRECGTRRGRAGGEGQADM